MHDQTQIARLRAHLEGGLPLPQDLAAWVLTKVLATAPGEYRRQQRDAHLLRAGQLVGGSCSQRAQEIQRHAAALERNWSIHRNQRPALGSIRGEVHAARLISPLPKPRQLRSILAKQSWQSRV